MLAVARLISNRLKSVQYENTLILLDGRIPHPTHGKKKKKKKMGFQDFS